MNVLAITILVSSCLAAIFVVCFAIESRRTRRTSLEHDSLTPIDSPADNGAKMKACGQKIQTLQIGEMTTYIISKNPTEFSKP